MRVKFFVVGQAKPYHINDLHMDVVPRVGEIVDLPGLSQADTVVRTVVWYPLGDPDEHGGIDSFVYIVLGRGRRVDREAGGP
jgi:hypothetical protein